MHTTLNRCLLIAAAVTATACAHAASQAPPAAGAPDSAPPAAAPAAAPAAVPSAIPPATTALPIVLVDHDNIEIRSSCRLQFRGPVADADGNGVIHVLAPGVVVDLAGATLNGAPLGTAPDALTGTGISVQAPRVIVRNGGVRGFKTGIHAIRCDQAQFHDLDLSGNFAQRLRSSPRAEDQSDWLWPHSNDAGEWRTNYGAALAIEQARGVSVHSVKAYAGQNGIMLDRVSDSSIYDNDCSFLSGWGIALWRSERNVVCRNAFDFCIRGYSHGFYNRGQDSAGILCFEQSSKNIFALNSATHGGDGFFGFAGKEALGESPAPKQFANDAERNAWYKDRGSNGNILLRNDFSDAAAHGMEMTFSSENEFVENTVERAAICGLWGGYGRRSLVLGNIFRECGGTGTKGERGGINIEHGSDWRVERNRFEGGGVGARFWWDTDAGLAKTPWSLASGVASTRISIVRNTFGSLELAVDLVKTTDSLVADNKYTACKQEIVADAESKESLRTQATQDPAPDTAKYDAIIAKLPGKATPVGARQALAGREKILMLTHGPFDHSGPHLVLLAQTPARDFWRVVGTGRLDAARAEGLGYLGCEIDVANNGITVYNEAPGDARSYNLVVAARDPAGGPTIILRDQGFVATGDWKIRAFATTADPRTDEAAFRAAAEKGAEGKAEAIDFRFGSGGPSDLMKGTKPALGEAIRDAKLPADHFGLVASTPMLLQPGCWQLRTVSDDGIRLKLDGKVVIDRWNWHAPTQDTYQFTLDAEKQVQVELEYFELDGHAEVSVWFEPCQPAAAQK